MSEIVETRTRRRMPAPRLEPPEMKSAFAALAATPAIYHVPREMLGHRTSWAGHFKRAASLGFNAMLLPAPFATQTDPSAPHAAPLVADFEILDPALGGGNSLTALANAAREAREAGLTLILDLAIDRIANNAALLTEHPDWFITAPQGAAFRHLAETDATVDWWDEQIAAWQNAGIGGFRCLGISAVQASIWARLISQAQARAPQTAFLAWTIGAAPTALAGLGHAGFTHGFSSSCWWDFSSSWLEEDAARLRRFGQTIAMAGPPGDQQSKPEPRLRAIKFAATYAPGWLLEAGFETGLEDEIIRLNALRGNHAVLAKAPPAQMASSAGTAVAVLAREAAGQQFLLAVNPSSALSASLPAAAFMPPLGAAHLTSLRGNHEITPGAAVTLPPYGVKMFNATEARPIKAEGASRPNEKNARIAIEKISPQVDEGQFPVRRILGEMVTVQADLIADGHDKLAGEILFRAADDTAFRAAPLRLLNNDRWEAQFPLERLGRYLFAVTAWKDVYASFVDEISKKHAAGVNIALELQEGRALVEAAKQPSILAALDAANEAGKLAIFLDPKTITQMRAADPRKFATTSHEILLDAEPNFAGFSSWYEVFPRSQAGDGKTHGNFRDVIRQLPRIAGMGFDVLYFPPIHPIGRTNRKGKNNTLTPAPDDPGSPYAIGAAEGGHDAIHPELGTLADFHALRDAAAELGVQLALDFAIQCAPDHPWLKQHPEWFDWRPDGSLRYAENPPKKYEDIVNVDFYTDGAQPSLWMALRDVVQFWVDQGVRLFRVDNPHTKPLPFWEWLIADIRARHPDTVFLAEAFTRPKLMYRLAKIGFAQSYTYFTWRNTKAELEDYFKELANTAPREFFRPHLFVNTPDINPAFLQTSGRGGFLIRAALAATLSGLWGVYNGFELCEATPVKAGKEEYLDSEKYQLKAWDYERPGNIVAEITKLNHIRKTNAALHSHVNVEFLPCDNGQVIYFRKFSEDGNMLLVAISLDPFNLQDATIEVPLWRFGIADDGEIAARDLMRDFSFTWRGKYQPVRLNPYDQPFCIWRISRP